MKTLHLLIIVSSIAISILTYFLLVPVTIIISDEASRIANDTASKYEIFPHETTWYVHITSDGKIKPSSNHDMINENSIFSCSFSVIPNDAKDHFAYLAVFRNNNTGYVVVLDDHTGKVIDAKPVLLELATCGP